MLQPPTGMDAIALHLEVRNAISLADELARYEHALQNPALASYLGAVRTSLAELERRIGRTHARHVRTRPALVEQLDMSLRVLRGSLHEAPAPLRPRFARLLASLERIVFAERRPHAPLPALPVLGGLPLGRVVPQDVHSVADFLAAAALVVTATLARDRRARRVGFALGAKLGGAALVSDVRLAPLRWLRVELHELLDYGIGLAAAIAPQVLGYRKKDPVVAGAHVLVGLGLVALSLVTDYRAERGFVRPVRSRGGPFARRGRGRRVREAQRPLEGLANPSALPRLRV